jgi:hypothetical protein
MQYLEITDACQATIGMFFDPATGEAVAARCKKWSCKVCGPRAARRFIARVMRTPRFTYFITLTSKPHGAMTKALVREFNAAWRAFRQWLKREVGIGDVTWVLEQGEKTGHLHRHALIDTSRSFSYKRARAALVRSGHGAVCDFKPSRSQHSAQAGARYLGKYLAKSLSDHASQWPRYSRRCQTSTPHIQRPKSTFIFIARPFAHRGDSPWKDATEMYGRSIQDLTDRRDFAGYQTSLESVRKSASEDTTYVQFLDESEANRGP